MSSLHAVILLISLSLGGIIFFQYHWLYTTLINNQRAFKKKLSVNIDRSWKSLVEERSRQPVAAEPSLKPDSGLSAARVSMALSNAFTPHQLSGLRFEYALNTDSGYVFSSSGFRALLQDSVRDKVQFYVYLSSHNNPYQGKVLTVLVPGVKSRLLREMSWMITGAVACTLIIIAIFCLMINAIIRQRKLNQLRQYFINNMVEAFTTPLSAISLAADALGNEKVRQDKAKMDYFSAVIKEENSRLQKHLEAVLHAPLKLYRAALKHVRR